MAGESDKTTHDRAGCCFRMPALRVRWRELTRCGDGHKSDCPVCETGVLTMERSAETGVLLERDRCCLS